MTVPCFDSRALTAKTVVVGLSDSALLQSECSARIKKSGGFGNEVTLLGVFREEGIFMFTVLPARQSVGATKLMAQRIPRCISWGVGLASYPQHVPQKIGAGSAGVVLPLIAFAQESHATPIRNGRPSTGGPHHRSASTPGCASEPVAEADDKAEGFREIEGDGPRAAVVVEGFLQDVAYF
ncbi:hypothetical protein LBMAG56_34160 [Verrucomicrobiota bacterium]|nr:hypothetical protein LBMAG56_34160 [Verrucomicrobiota bacterium]